MVVAVRRDDRAKRELSLANLETRIPQMLERIHGDIYDRADERYRTSRNLVIDWNDFVLILNGKDSVSYLAPRRSNARVGSRVKVKAIMPMNRWSLALWVSNRCAIPCE
jgi:hypothetical protein